MSDCASLPIMGMVSPYDGKPVKFVECEDRLEPVGNRIADILTYVTEQICDGYCKWPDVYSINYADRPEEGQEAMMAQKCRYCPLMEL